MAVVSTQIASVSTPSATMRSSIDGWTFEDTALIKKPPGAFAFAIGFTPSPKDIPFYGCVLEMLGDGWDLLGPPSRMDDEWVWWLQRKRPS